MFCSASLAHEIPSKILSNLNEIPSKHTRNRHKTPLNPMIYNDIYIYYIYIYIPQNPMKTHQKSPKIPQPSLEKQTQLVPSDCRSWCHSHRLHRWSPHLPPWSQPPGRYLQTSVSLKNGAMWGPQTWCERWFINQLSYRLAPHCSNIIYIYI